MTQSWIEAEFHDRWTLSADELTLLPGMTDKGRLGFAIQLKFMQLHDRFPERPEEIDPAAAQWLATQLHTPVEIWSTYEPQNRHHQIEFRETFVSIVISDLRLEQLAQQLAAAEGTTVERVVCESLLSRAGRRGLTVHEQPLRERLKDLARKVDASSARSRL